MGIIDDVININGEQAEKTYTKSDVMKKLSMLEAPIREDCECESCSSPGCKLFSAGARAMATALLDEMDADEVRCLKCLSKWRRGQLITRLEASKMALKTVSVEDIPLVRDLSILSELHKFADETISEFAESGYEAALVEGIPKGYKTQQVVNQLRNAAYRQKLNWRIKVMQRKNEVYLKREY